MGFLVGLAVGLLVGFLVGLAVGFLVGLAVGCLVVGAGVGRNLGGTHTEDVL